jgi:hypothetical protein
MFACSPDVDLFDRLKELQRIAGSLEAGDLGMDSDETVPELPPELSDDELREIARRLEALDLSRPVGGRAR